MVSTAKAAKRRSQIHFEDLEMWPTKNYATALLGAETSFGLQEIRRHDII